MTQLTAMEARWAILFSRLMMLMCEVSLVEMGHLQKAKIAQNVCRRENEECSSKV